MSPSFMLVNFGINYYAVRQYKFVICVYLIYLCSIVPQSCIKTALQSCIIPLFLTFHNCFSLWPVDYFLQRCSHPDHIPGHLVPSVDEASLSGQSLLGVYRHACQNGIPDKSDSRWGELPRVWRWGRFYHLNESYSLTGHKNNNIFKVVLGTIESLTDCSYHSHCWICINTSWLVLGTTLPWSHLFLQNYYTWLLIGSFHWHSTQIANHILPDRQPWQLNMSPYR